MVVPIRIAKFIIDARLLISLAAAALAVSTLKILNLNLDWRFLWVILTCTHVAYMLPLFMKVESSTWWWKIAFMGLGVNAAICAYILSFSRNIETYFLFAILCFCSLLYYLPLGRLGRLREVPFMKVFLIAFVWSLATAALPATYNGLSILDTSVFLLMVERFFFLLALAIPFDIRDLKKDRQEGLLTLPIAIGMKQSMLLSAALLIAYCAVSILHYGFGNLVFVRAISAFAVLILLQKTNLIRSSYYFTGLLDGMMIFQSALICLVA